MTDRIFADKVAVVTGASGTLCSALAIELARRGAKVALLGRTMDKLQGVAQTIEQAGGTALCHATDVTDLQAVKQAHATVAAKLGPCELLINGAGGNHPQAVTTLNEFSPQEIAADKPDEVRGFFNLDLARAEEIIRLNTLGTMIPCQVFGRDMAQRGRGAILNFSSMNNYQPLSRNAAYALSKAGVTNFTMWLAAYLAPAGVRVNAVAPGFFVNERSRKILLTPDGELTPRGQQVMHHTPMKRFGEPAALLGACCWLLDDKQAEFVTGITVPVDGGFLATSGV